MARNFGSPGDINCGSEGPPQANDMRNLWKSYLYHMQQKAPPPKRIICNKDLPNRPQHYGKEYHGAIKRDEAERLVCSEGEGAYLVRESSREPGQFSLVFLFDGQPKNYRLYYTDNQHYVGSKRFNTLQDLVADGLITMYLNTHAGEYIRQMCNEVSYEDSPYFTLNQSKKHMYYKSTRRRMKDKKPPVPPTRRRDPPAPPMRPPPIDENQSAIIDGMIHQYDEPEFMQPPTAVCSLMAPLSEASLEELPEPPSDLMDSPPRVLHEPSSGDDLDPPKLRHAPTGSGAYIQPTVLAGSGAGGEAESRTNSDAAYNRRSEPQQPINRRSYVDDSQAGAVVQQQQQQQQQQLQHYQQPGQALRRAPDPPASSSSDHQQQQQQQQKQRKQQQASAGHRRSAQEDIGVKNGQERSRHQQQHHHYPVQQQQQPPSPSSKRAAEERHPQPPVQKTQQQQQQQREHHNNRHHLPQQHQHHNHHHRQKSEQDGHQQQQHPHQSDCHPKPHQGRGQQQQQQQQPHKQQQPQPQQLLLQQQHLSEPLQQLHHNQQQQKQKLSTADVDHRPTPVGFPIASLEDSSGWSHEDRQDRVTAFNEASSSPEVDDGLGGEDDDDEVDEEDLPNAKDFEKAHVFKVHNFMGLPWCDFCGNFMWGLIAQGVKCEDCGFSAHSKCSEKVPSDCTPDLKFVKRVFGVDLTTLCKLHDMPRPFVIEMCIKEVELRGMQVEGLYRVSGSKDEIEQLQAAFEQLGDQTPLDIKTYEDINVVSGCLKNFFRLLPIPLITYDAYGMFVNAVRRLEPEDKVEGLRVAVRSLPPAHYQSLKYLMQHLNRVTDQAKLNKMSADNLSRIFAPTLLRSPDSMGIDLQAALQTEAIVIEMLVTHHRAIMDI